MEEVSFTYKVVPRLTFACQECKRHIEAYQTIAEVTFSGVRCPGCQSGYGIYWEQDPAHIVVRPLTKKEGT